MSEYTTRLDMKVVQDLQVVWRALERMRSRSKDLPPEVLEPLGAIITRASQAAAEIHALHSIAEEQLGAAKHPPARLPAVHACLELIGASGTLLPLLAQGLAGIEGETDESTAAVSDAAGRLLERVETAVADLAAESEPGPSWAERLEDVERQAAVLRRRLELGTDDG